MPDKIEMRDSPGFLPSSKPDDPYLWKFPSKPSKIYVAASLSNQLRALQLATLLTNAGFHVTSRWLMLDFKSLPKTPYSKFIEVEQTMGNQDRQDLEEADTLVIMTDEPSSSGGFHFELGYFMGLRKGNILCLGPRPNVFYWNMLVRSLPTVDGAVDFLTSERHGS